MITAKHNNVILKQLDIDNRMYGNIIIPDVGKEKPLIGEVIDVGPGTYTAMGNMIPMTTQVGDVVFFPSFGGVRVSYDSTDYIVCKDTDLLATLEDDSKIL